MKNWILIVFVVLVTLIPLESKAQYSQQDTIYPRYFVGSTFFMLANLVPDDNAPDFVQLNIGYRLTPRDAVSLEIKTWKYAWPLGIPYGPLKEDPEERFPGYIREYGAAIAYQHFFWKGLYAGVHVMGAWQTFRNEDDIEISKGFQIFNTYRVGYHVKLFKDRFFLEPSICITHRAYHTDLPDSFQVLDNKWSKFFFGEPGLHFGYKF